MKRLLLLLILLTVFATLNAQNRVNTISVQSMSTDFRAQTEGTKIYVIDSVRTYILTAAVANNTDMNDVITSGYYTIEGQNDYLPLKDTVLLSDLIVQGYYTMTFQTLTNSAAISDATTYYLVPNATNLTTSATEKHQVCPVNSTLVGYTISIFNGTAGSSQETSTFYCRVNNTTDITLNSSVTWSASASTTTTFYGMALNSDVDAGDTYNIKIVTPTWTTNPQNFYMTATLYFKTR